MANLAGLAALLSLLFALVVGARWLRGHRPAFLFWALGLLIFAAAAAAQSLGESRGFASNVTLFQLFYLLGGALGVIYLALGTLYLLAPRRVADVSLVVLLVFTVVVAIDAFIAPIDRAKLATPAGVLGGAYTNAAVLQAAVVVFNIVGTVIFAGGAAWSGWRYLRDRAGLDRIVCNVLLTAGALVIAAGFSAAKTVGATSIDPLGAYEAIGIAVMFVGFLSLGRVGLRSPRRSTLPPAAAGAR
ncbi:MAG TPA: hypothetical protein VEK76_14110 [Candidatus Binatia bacterium]|nr:hypothetical protein [Candidatus Binatia bacterium]